MFKSKACHRLVASGSKWSKSSASLKNLVGFHGLNHYRSFSSSSFLMNQASSDSSNAPTSNTQKMLLKNTTVGTTPTKPLKFKASDGDPKKEEKPETREKVNPSNKLFNVVVCLALATAMFLQFTKYHEAIDTDANDGSLTVVLDGKDEEEEYTIYTNRHHFCMRDLIAISSNSFVTRVQEVNKKGERENLVVVYNPTKLDSTLKQKIDSLFLPDSRNSLVILLPNQEHRLFFADYYYEFVFNPSKSDSKSELTPRVLFLCGKDEKDTFVEEARKNIVMRKEISVTTVVDVDSNLFMEYGRFAGVSKRSETKDSRKDLVDLVARHFSIYKVRGLDNQLAEAFLYHKKSGFIMACDLIMNMVPKPEVEGETSKPIIALKEKDLEPYVIKYARYFDFGGELDVPVLDKRFILNTEKIKQSVDEITSLPWGGVGMAHGDYILLSNCATEEERKAREEALKEKWRNSWEKRLTQK